MDNCSKLRTINSTHKEIQLTITFAGVDLFTFKPTSYCQQFIHMTFVGRKNTEICKSLDTNFRGFGGYNGTTNSYVKWITNLVKYYVQTLTKLRNWISMKMQVSSIHENKWIRVTQGYCENTDLWLPCYTFIVVHINIYI